MKNLLLIMLILTFGFSFTHAQKNQSKPEEKTFVNKEFDEDGNLIKYDSTFVWSWSGDSAFQFEFPKNEFFEGKNFPGFEEMFADSAFANQFNHQFFGLEPFNNEEFFKQFEHQFPDSAFSGQFEFFGDSANVFPFDLGNGFSDEFFSNDFEQLHKELRRQLGEMDSKMPRFESDEQRKVWEELLQKQQKEKEELLKKWEHQPLK